MKRTLRHLLIIGITLVFLTSVHGQSFLTNGLVAYYPFKGNARDASGSTNDGTVYRAVLTGDRYGQPNSAYRFNGSNAFIEVLQSPSFHFSNGTFTISAWIKADMGAPWQLGYAAGGVIVSKEKAGEQVPQFRMALESLAAWADDDGKAIFHCVDGTCGMNWLEGSGYQCESQEPIGAGAWHQLVVTANRSTFQFFVNGEPRGRDAISQAACLNIANNPYPLRIGARHGFETNTPLNCFAGVIDDVRIYDKALTDSEVGQLFVIEAGLLQVRKAVYLESSVGVGTNYQLQVSSDLVRWTNYGIPFTATNAYWRSSNYWDVFRWNRLHFRLIPQ